MTTRLTIKEFNEMQLRQADERHLPVIRAYEELGSYDKVAVMFNITKARVQQIIKRADRRGLRRQP